MDTENSVDLGHSTNGLITSRRREWQRRAVCDRAGIVSMCEALVEMSVKTQPVKENFVGLTRIVFNLRVICLIAFIMNP